MTHAKQNRWSYSTGERGRNRVRAFAHQTTGLLFLELTDGGRRRRVALGHRDTEAAKAKADELAAALRTNSSPLDAHPRLQPLFDNYLREVTPQKAATTQKSDRRAAERFLRFFGPDRRASMLNRRDWDAYVMQRRRGGDTRTGKAKGRPVRNRIIECDLKFLVAVLNWATNSRDGSGRFLLERNPLKGMPWPRESSPHRPMVTDDDYRAMLDVAPRIDELCPLALVLAHETGHRIGAIRLLRWSDVNLEKRSIRWRGDQDKIGFEHETPLTEAAVAALHTRRRQHPVIGDAWILPAPGNPHEPCSRHLLRDWWERLERLAGLAPCRGRGWHSLRRLFATELKDVPLRDLCQLGGWKDAQTILKCYQKPDEGTMRGALASRGRLRSSGVLEPNRHTESTHRADFR